LLGGTNCRFCSDKIAQNLAKFAFFKRYLDNRVRFFVFRTFVHWQFAQHFTIFWTEKAFKQALFR